MSHLSSSELSKSEQTIIIAWGRLCRPAEMENSLVGELDVVELIVAGRTRVASLVALSWGC